MLIIITNKKGEKQMKKKNELSYKDLKITCDPEVFTFSDTSEL